MTLETARPSRPIWSHLAVFAMIIVVPLWCLLGFLAVSSVQTARKDHEAQTRAMARNLALELDRELAGFAGILRALATSPALEDNDFRRFHEQAVRMAPPDGTIVMRDSTGQQIINTRLPPGTSLPVSTNAAVRQADACVFETREPCLSGVYEGQNSRLPNVILNMPVLRGETVVYALSIRLRAHYLASVLADRRLPAQWNVSIVDQSGRVVARLPDHERFAGREVSTSLRTALAHNDGALYTVNLSGVPVWAAHVQLPAWGWDVVIGAPQAVLNAPLNQFMLHLAGAGLLAVAFSLAAAIFFGRRFARPFKKLSQIAGQVGNSGVPPPVHSSICELNRISNALSEGSQRLQTSIAERDQAQADLQQLNEILQARVEAEVAARQAAQQQLAHSQRMEALGQLAGGVAHDFNNVLQAIQGGASLLEGTPNADERTRRLAKMIGEAGARGAAVTRRLLALARRADLHAEPVEPADLLAAMREIFAHTLGAGVAVQVQVAPGAPAMLADRLQLETALVNLATNARDAMAGAGTLTLLAAAEFVPLSGGGSLLPALKPGSYVRLTVSDTGSGMDEATLARAMEPFFTTKPQGQGTGLGLAMARGFVEQSGGAIRVESQVGQGTTVRLWLPVAHGETAINIPATGQRPSPCLRRRVLVVDDEAMVREVVAEGLEAAGFAVRAVASGAEALALLDVGERVDALITDLSMPGMDGLLVIREAQARRRDLPAILLTGYANDMAELAVSGAVTGRFSLLRKPIEAHVLAERVAVLTALSEEHAN